jgi:hypothetical protein
MFIEGKRKRKGIAYRIVKIYRYKVPSRNRTYNIIYKSTTPHDNPLIIIVWPVQKFALKISI